MRFTMKKDTKIGFILTYFHNSHEGYELLKKNVEIISRENYYFVIASHSPLPIELQEMCDFYFYQQKNVVDSKRYSHGVAENNLIQISLKHLQSNGIEWTYKISYDIELNDVSRFKDWINEYKYKFVSCNWGDNILCTNSFFTNVDFVLKNIDFYDSIDSMFSVNNILENCWEKNIRDKHLLHEIYSFKDKETFYGDNKIDMLFYNYSDITFSYSTEENRFYISNNTQNETINKLRIFDYYSDTVIDVQNNTNITPGSTWWFVPPYSGNIPNAKNGYYVEIYFSDRVVRKNTGIIDFDYKHPLHKKFLKHKFEEIKYNEFSDFSEYELYNEFNIKPNEVKTYIDIGANYGMSSIPFIASNSKVYMIDADSTNIRILENSYGKDNRIKIINKAIHSYDGVTSFYEDINGSCVSSISYSNVNGSSDNRIEKKVECISPNTLIERYVDEDEIDLLKIDIEGAEYEFFSSISDENIKKIKKFVIEFHMNENYRVMNIIKKLTKNDFKFRLARWERENNDDYIVSHTWGIIYAWN